MKREALNTTVSAAPPLDQDELIVEKSEITEEGKITVEHAPDGTEKHYLDGKLHRDGDLPAIIYPPSKGGKSWWKNGKPHRDGDLPAMITPNGTKCWYKEGKLHREGGKPAIVYTNGKTEQWVDGKFVFPKKKKRRRRIIEE